MKIFIGGTKTINKLDDRAKELLHEMITSGDEILIGDCFGVDKAVQKFFYDNNYQNVTVYASGNVVRNNVGNFKVKHIQTDKKGFEFYRQKDIAMAKDADRGFMIWNGKSKGTLCDISDLKSKEKIVVVYNAETGLFS